MKKTNYLIPTLSILFLGVAAFFIVKGIDAKKSKKDKKDEDKPKKRVGSIIVGDPTKEEPFPSEIEDITQKKLAAKVLISKAGTRLREKPSTSATIVKSLAKGIKLNRVPNNPINFLANLPVKDGDNYWVYVQIDNALTKGYVRTDAVNI
jgi:hypothetical protein